MKRSERIEIFVEEIWSWHARHKRVLPWRDLRTKDVTQRAYMVLVSEIMLQQTQVSRVEVAFKRFLQQFPTLGSLARASTKDVLIAWRGMGYNSRALRLRDSARMIEERFGGIFPSGFEELRSIKGVGDYTAGAIRNFAFNIPTPCIDTNIRRILHRTFVGPENPDGTWRKDDKYLLKLAAEVLEVALREKNNFEVLSSKFEKNSQFLAPRSSAKRSEVGSILNSQFGRSPSAWHSALMDFGSLVCTKRNPKWDNCPLTKRGIMKAAFKVVETPRRGVSKKNTEPGRIVGSTFIPNRIFRGKIVDALRDAQSGLTLEILGKEICIDWNAQHRSWLQGILDALIRDRLIINRKPRYVLADCDGCARLENMHTGFMDQMETYKGEDAVQPSANGEHMHKAVDAVDGSVPNNSNSQNTMVPVRLGLYIAAATAIMFMMLRGREQELEKPKKPVPEKQIPDREKQVVRFASVQELFDQIAPSIDMHPEKQNTTLIFDLPEGAKVADIHCYIQRMDLANPSLIPITEQIRQQGRRCEYDLPEKLDGKKVGRFESYQLVFSLKHLTRLNAYKREEYEGKSVQTGKSEVGWKEIGLPAHLAAVKKREAKEAEERLAKQEKQKQETEAKKALAEAQQKQPAVAGGAVPEDEEDDREP